MSHSVQITLIANQIIELFGNEVNVHNIKSIVVDGKGIIREVYLKDVTILPARVESQLKNDPKST